MARHLHPAPHPKQPPSPPCADVAFTTFIACLLPFFNSIVGERLRAAATAGHVPYSAVMSLQRPQLTQTHWFLLCAGLIGALIFWPCGVFFPSWMYITAFKPSSQFRHFLYALNVIMLM